MNFQRKVDFLKLSDRELFARCRLVGGVVLKYRNQFLGMLPEVERRRLYLKYRMHSVQEFASRLAGISRETVDEVLRVDEHLKETPRLQEKLHSGEIGWSKLQVVASVVTPDNEDQWFEKVSTMSKSALQMYVHEFKSQNVKSEAEFPAGWENKAENPVLFSEEYLPHQIPRPVHDDRETFSFSISRHTAARIRVFKLQLEKKFKRPLTLEQMMEEFLRMAEDESTKSNVSDKITEQKSFKSEKPQVIQNIEKSDKLQESLLEKSSGNVSAKCVNRHIPASVRREIWRRYRGVCGFSHCNQAIRNGFLFIVNMIRIQLFLFVFLMNGLLIRV